MQYVRNWYQCIFIAQDVLYKIIDHSFIEKHETHQLLKTKSQHIGVTLHDNNRDISSPSRYFNRLQIRSPSPSRHNYSCSRIEITAATFYIRQRNASIVIAELGVLMHNSVAKKENTDYSLAPRKRNWNIYEHAEAFC